jgi:hypothetical protein
MFIQLFALLLLLLLLLIPVPTFLSLACPVPVTPQDRSVDYNIIPWLYHQGDASPVSHDISCAP